MLNTGAAFFTKLKQTSKFASIGKLKPLNDQVIDWSWADLICAKMHDMTFEFFHKLECTGTKYLSYTKDEFVIWSVLMRHKTASLRAPTTILCIFVWTPQFSHAFSHWKYVETHQLVKSVLSQTPGWVWKTLQWTSCSSSCCKAKPKAMEWSLSFYDKRTGHSLFH